MPHTSAPAGRRLIWARALSVLGHPALLMPLAASVSAATRADTPGLAGIVAAVSVTLALVVMLFSAWQVRVGRWRHVDASVPQERRSLNLLLCGLLFGGATLLLAGGVAPAVALGLGLGGVLVLLALLLQRWLKLSLHVAFASYAALLAWPAWGWVLAGLALAAGVAWSRLVLGRHRPPDLWAGALAGVAVGALFVA
ncbi:MAG: phosphoesterase [Rubrivivax sp.]|nr:phosphoesterase [Rubrivivax sp.]